jgi:hypothetical protein
VARAEFSKEGKAMSMLSTHEKIIQAELKGFRDALDGIARKTSFEFPNEERAYNEGYDRGMRAR